MENVNAVLYSATLLIGILFLSKWIEVKTGSQKFLGKAVSRLNPHVERVVYFFRYRIYQIIQIVRYILLVRLPSKGRQSINEAKEAAKREYKRNKDILMGKKDLKASGASFFLKKIKEEQDNGKNGKIVDSL